MKKYTALSVNKRSSIIKHLKTGKNQVQIAKQLGLSGNEVSQYLDFYYKQKIIDGRKHCRICGSWKLATEENFKKSSNYRKDGSTILYSLCKLCCSRRLKNEVIMKTDRVKKSYEVRNARVKKLKAEGKWKYLRLDNMTPEQIERRRTSRRKQAAKRKAQRLLNKQKLGKENNLV